MYFQSTSSSETSALRLPYAQASMAQRELLLTYLRQRLRYHFPTLSPAAWLRALFEFQPILVLTDMTTVTLDEVELRQLVQHLAGQPELSLLDPQIYGLPALYLAQRWLRSQELLATTQPELETFPKGPRLNALLTDLSQPYLLAEQVIQAWRWDLSTSPPLPTGLPRN